MSVGCVQSRKYQVQLGNQGIGFQKRWPRNNVQRAAEAVLEEVVGVGCLLPLVQFGGAQVFPIVEWGGGSLAQRTESASAPVLHPSQIHDLLEDPIGIALCPPALSIVGFLGIAPLTNARRELAGLRSLGRTIAMVPRPPSVSRTVLAEFDLQGTAVVSCLDEIRVLIGGDPGARRGSDMSPIWKRFYEEQLFDWAIRAGAVPA